MTNKPSGQPKLRYLTITHTAYDYQLTAHRHPRPPSVPFLRLRGYWLHRAGFAAGQRVSIEVSDQRITITPAPHT